MLAEAMFERIDVLGAREAVIHPTPEAIAHGWREVWGNAVLTAADHRDRYGRGERHCPATNDLLVMRLAEPPEPCEWLRSA